MFKKSPGFDGSTLSDQSLHSSPYMCICKDAVIFGTVDNELVKSAVYSSRKKSVSIDWYQIP